MSRWPRWWAPSRGWRLTEEPGADGRAGVAGERAHGHAQGLRVAGPAGAGEAGAGPARRPPVRVPGPARRSHQGDLARRAGRVPVLKAAGARPLHLAHAIGRRRVDLAGAARLHAGRHRLARAEAHFAASDRWLIESTRARGVAPATRPQIYVRRLIEARAKQLWWRAWRSIPRSFPTTSPHSRRC